MNILYVKARVPSKPHEVLQMKSFNIPHFKPMNVMMNAKRLVLVLKKEDDAVYV